MAWLLIVAYLPMLVASVVHVHPQSGAGPTCPDCARSVAHPAHIDARSADVQSCLYCHLLTLPALPMVVAAVTVLVAVVRMVRPRMAVATCRRCCRATLRGPPAAR